MWYRRVKDIQRVFKKGLFRSLFRKVSVAHSALIIIRNKMGQKYFGTDGIRGRVGQGNITPEFVLKLGWAAGLLVRDRKQNIDR